MRYQPFLLVNIPAHVMAICLMLWPAVLLAQNTSILVDGLFDDWQNENPAYADVAGDQAGGGIDFGRIWMANDRDYFYFRLEVRAEINLQDGNDITLYLDTDGNSDTGLAFDGMGAELEWTFGRRSGAYYRDGGRLTVGHAQIGLVTAPTVSSNTFEVALSRRASPDEAHLLFDSEELNLALVDKGAGRDRLPDQGESLNFAFTRVEAAPVPPLPLHKQNSRHVRVVTFNVLNDGPFDPARGAAIKRIIAALRPDVLGLQEIYQHAAEDVLRALLPALDQGENRPWFAARIEPDIITISRFPIERAAAIGGNGAFLLRPGLPGLDRLLLLNAHLPCCGNDAGRQAEVDAIMQFIRHEKEGGGSLQLPPNTPIVILGDLNLVGQAQQLKTLLNGEIVNTGEYGPAFLPDWDGTPFEAAMPRQANAPMTFTWFSRGSAFSPGKLDYVIYSDSVLRMAHGLVLFSENLPADTLAAYGLAQNETTVASDHLPVVVDFSAGGATAVENGSAEAAAPVQFSLFPNRPNPFREGTVIRFTLAQPSHARVEIFDARGRLIRSLAAQRWPAGTHELKWDGVTTSGRQAAAGLYFVRVRMGASTIARKILRLQ